ncbi:MAG: SDR family oxidoreductase, partial [Bauldia sp.]
RRTIWPKPRPPSRRPEGAPRRCRWTFSTPAASARRSRRGAISTCWSMPPASRMSSTSKWPRTFLDVTEEEFDAVMDLNVRAAFFVSQAVAEGMVRAQCRGSIVHVSSQMGHVGGELRSAYCASKWALEGLTRASAIELAPHGIRVNTLAPTFIETALTARSLADPGYRAHVMSKIRLGRLGRVEDLMGAVLFLASDASALMTGTSLVIDGGWTAG